MKTTIPVTRRLLQAVLSWAKENSIEVSSADARSWDDWPHGRESCGASAAIRGGKWNRIAADLLERYRTSTGTKTEKVTQFSDRTGEHSSLDLS